jgi:hypothetical protein
MNTIKVGDIIKFSLSQPKPFSGVGKVIRIYPKGWFEVDVYPYMIAKDEIIP